MAYAEMDSMFRMLGASVVHVEPGLAIVEMGCGAAERIPRELAYVKEVGAVLYREPVGEGSTPYAWIRSLRGLYRPCGGRVDIKIYIMGRRSFEADYSMLVEEVRKLGQGGEPRLGCLDSISIVVGSIAIVGYPVARRIKRSSEGDGRRYMGWEDLAFMAIIYRNLRGGGRVFDLFCGYGHILREACARASPETIVGGEIDLGKALASKKILGSECYSEVVVGDALHPPFRRGCADAVISDLPYGRRSRAHSDEAPRLPLTFLETSRDILSDDGLVIAAVSMDQFRHSAKDVINSGDYKILYLCTQYVHGSLSRVYMVLKRVGERIDLAGQHRDP